MRKLVLITLAIFVLTPFSYAIEKKVIEKSNSFGGVTVKTVYGSNDNEFKLSSKIEFLNGEGVVRQREGYRLLNQYNTLKIEKVIEDYASNGSLFRSEIIIAEEKARELGYHKIVTFYSLDGNTTSKEVYYNDTELEKMVYTKSIEYYSVVGKKVKSVFFLTEENTEQTGYSKLISYFENDKMIRQEVYDKDGKLL